MQPADRSGRRRGRPSDRDRRAPTSARSSWQAMRKPAAHSDGAIALRPEKVRLAAPGAAPAGDNRFAGGRDGLPLPRRRDGLPGAHGARTRDRSPARELRVRARAFLRGRRRRRARRGRPMPVTTFGTEHEARRPRQVAGQRPAAPLPARILRGAVAHHGARLVPHAGRIRRPRAAARRRRAPRPHARKLRALLRPSRSTGRSSSSRSGTRSPPRSICLVLAYPLAALIARSDRKHRDLLLLLVILPFWSNFLIRVYAWMIILGPNAALARAVNGVLGLFGVEPVSLLFSAFAVLVCLVYVHLPFMVLPLYANLEKHDQHAARRGAGPGRQRVAALLADHVSAVAARRVRGRGAGVHPGVRHLRDSGHPGRPGRQPHRQRDQAAVPRDARLAVRQRAVDRADRAARSGLAGLRRVDRQAQPLAVGARTWTAGRCDSSRGARGALAVERGALRVRVPLPAARHRRRLLVQRLEAQRRMGRLHARLVSQARRQQRDAARPPAIRCSSRSWRASCRRCSARWPASRCIATACGSCRSWC